MDWIKEYYYFSLTTFFFSSFFFPSFSFFFFFQGIGRARAAGYYLGEDGATSWVQYVPCQYDIWCTETNGFDCIQKERESNVLEVPNGPNYRSQTGNDSKLQKKSLFFFINIVCAISFVPLVDCLPLKMKNLSKPFKTDLKTVITHFF